MKRLCYFVTALLVALSPAAPALADTENSFVDSVCPVCGLCPAPGGFCLFLIVAAVLAIAIIALAISSLGKRCPLCKTRCKLHDYTCPKCGYDFESGLQSTMTIRVADSPELMALREQATPAPAPRPVQTPAAVPVAFPAAAVAAPAPAEEKKCCPVCGAALPAKAMFCGKCGRRLE